MSTLLVWPAQEYLAGYMAALQRGWSPDNLRPEAAHEELQAIDEDSSKFLATLVDREGLGPAIKLPDGSLVPRLPGYRKWIWDGEFCGSVGFRWSPGTSALPAYVTATRALVPNSFSTLNGIVRKVQAPFGPRALSLALNCFMPVLDIAVELQ
jgi:hypothetical protein